MSTIFLVHGVEGSPEENWFPWLRKELESQGHTVIVPQFPTPKNQTLAAWREVLSRYEKDISRETLFVAHSLGVPFVLHALERYPARAAFLVAGFVRPLDIELARGTEDFLAPFDWETIRSHCEEFFCFHSDDDPYVPPAKAREVAQKLGTASTLVPGAGHFHLKSGYDSFPRLLQKMQPVLFSH
ncbi:MAG: alpha/beta hydrolase [Candidatus Gracilibacteria bacterium]|nr:alpha/beta hydrolase [Candidatus Gracilibacteria bacterium]